MKNLFNNKVFIVAELSANHNGSLELALKTIEAAKRAGADAIKLQTYTADTITLNHKSEEFKIKGTIWNGRYLYDLYKEAHTPWEWHPKLFEFAKEQGLLCFSSPFDTSAVDFLETLENPIYKISSFEITDIPLIKYIAKKNKPIIISTGIANYEDISLALKTCRDEKNNKIAILKCTSSYPSPIEYSNLIMIKDMANEFNVVTGLSDHTLGITCPVLSVGFGAKIIEKHFVLNKNIKTVDSEFSLDEDEFSLMVTEVRKAEKAIGDVNYNLTEEKIKSRKFARSLYVTQNVKKGDKVSPDNLRSIRPNFGLHPKYYSNLINKTFNQDVSKGTPASLNYFE